MNALLDDPLCEIRPYEMDQGDSPPQPHLPLAVAPPATPPSNPTNPGLIQPPDDGRAAAEWYRSKGFGLARIRAVEKRPTDAGWTERSAEPDQFLSGDNVGLLCGWLSDGGTAGRHLVCVDLDSREAIEKADAFLPPTRAVEGRPSKARSHRWFLVGGVPEWATSTAEAATAAAQAAGKHPGPFKKQFRHATTGQTVIDFIGTGGQAAAPPSVHDSGEVRAWEPGHGVEQAAVLPFETLWEAVCGLALACGAAVPDVRKGATAIAPRRIPLPVIDLKEVPSSAAAPGQVQGTCTRIDVPMAERVEKCREYLNAAKLAKSGQGGHKTTYRVARIVTNDFAVTDRAKALELMQGYNARLIAAGEEAWSIYELEHKLDDALNDPPDKEYLFGCRLIPREWDDAGRLAEEFLTEHTLVFLKNTGFEYDGRAYRVVTPDWLLGLVRLFIERRAQAEFSRELKEWERKVREVNAQTGDLPAGWLDDAADHAAQLQAKKRAELLELNKKKPRAVPPVSVAMVANAAAAVRARGQLADATDLDTWLSGRGPVVLSVENGLLDPVTRTLRPHTPDWFAVTALPVRFDPDAPTPERWLRFLQDVTAGDAALTAVLQEVFGGCLDRTAPGKWFAMLVGSGDNGKSVLLRVLGLLLGERNCAAVGLAELSTSRFASFELYGMLANLVADQGYLESADEGRLKTLTGGDLVMFEQKGRDPFAAINRAKLVFACNTLPTFGDKSGAVWGRLQAVPFTYTVQPEKKDPALMTEAYWGGELSGILNWALEGLERFRRQGGQFTRSVKCEELKAAHRLDSNPARRFLEEHFEWTGNASDFVRVADLYTEYTSWAARNGFKTPLTSPKFAREVESAFPKVGQAVNKRTGNETHRVRKGLRRRPDAEGDPSVTPCDGLFTEAPHSAPVARCDPPVG